jgi:hypothetical protein
MSAPLIVNTPEREDPRRVRQAIPAEWVVAIDEAQDDETWTIEIDSPGLYLTFRLDALSAVRRAVEILDRSVNLQGASGKKYSPEEDEINLGNFGGAVVQLIRDNEDFPRCFIVVGPRSRSTLRVGISGDNIRIFTQALRDALQSCGE